MAARQVLKLEIKSGKFLTPPEKAEKEENEGTKEAAQKVAHTLKEAIEKYEEWLPEFPPKWVWKAMTEESDECPLLTDAQVDQLCATAISLSDMGFLKRGKKIPQNLRRFMEQLTAARQNFGDYLRLLALCGAREQETIRQRWSNVR